MTLTAGPCRTDHPTPTSADARLTAGAARDAAADARDAEAARHDDLADSHAALPASQPLPSAPAERRVSAAYREQAARERTLAREDRESLADELAATQVDALTGARSRAAGLSELDREVQRSTRTGSPLVVAYADVVGLKHRNDTRGHADGDRLLTRVAQLMIEHVRPYDLVVRLAGDEFLCAMPAMTVDGARRRFALVSRALGDGPHSGAITVGFAAHEAGESTARLIARADAELAAERAADGRTRPTAPQGD